MDLLWTVSNWKRTGPVEPSLGMARAMVERGHRIRVACGTRPKDLQDDAPRNDTEDVVAAYGLERAGTGARLDKHSSPLRDRRDVDRLSAWMADVRPDAVVTTLRNDHGLAARAARAHGVPVVRLWFRDGSENINRRERRALAHTHGVLVFGKRPLDQLEALIEPPKRIRRCGPPLDIERLRAQWTTRVPSERFRFGIVARMQTHRRFEMLWKAVATLHAQDGPPFELLAIGRGTHQKKVAHDPVQRLGLTSVVSFPGYLRGTEYVNTLASLDAQLFLVPGSDATCRALREGMALGVPSITTHRGLLPEIVQERETALLVTESAAHLARAMDTLRRDPELASAMGGAARRRAEERFDVRRVAETLDRLLGGHA